MKRRKRGKQTLKRKMLSILLLCAMSCILAVVIVSYMTIRMIQNDSIQESMQIYLEQITREIDSDYYDMIGIVNQMSPNGLIGSVTESYLSVEDNYDRYFEQKSLREELIKLGYVNTKLLGIAYYDPKEQKELIGNFNVRVLDPSYQTISKVVVGAENIIQAMHASYLGIRETPVLSVMRRVSFGNKRVLDIYAEISKEYQKLKDSYENMRQMFLNEQAGMLAADLKPGFPCPVCGSIDHPHPFAGAVDHVDISPENLQTMAQDVENFRVKQEQAANESHAAKTEYETRKETFVEAVGRLRNRMQKSISEIQKDAGLSEMNEALKIWKNSIDISLKTLKKDAEKLRKIRELLQGADEQRKILKENLELCRATQTEAARKLTEDTAQLNSFRTSCEFASEKEASDTLEKAETAKQASEKIYKKAADALDAASSAKQNAETLIAKYQKEIPAQEEKLAVKKAAYMDFMQEKQMTEEVWKQLVKENSRDTEKNLTDTVEAYREAKAAAIAQKKAAGETIGDAQKPDLAKIKAEKEAAETAYQSAEKRYSQLKSDYKDNQEILTALSARMEKRKAVVEEHARIDALYRMTSGNVSGSRMDLETFVQRYYLERILYAANRRFQEMSAGQFELRMYDLKKAGEGKNRGLDLMVYSTVTGKEREVRTLSGGESFMAALSLALGMADQIKQSSAAINLDMMFIDEGFGSLDEHSRNQAVRVLQEMAEGSRLIGIISHVSELKQEIEDQLIVTKDENGSHVKWQIS